MLQLGKHQQCQILNQMMMVPLSRRCHIWEPNSQRKLQTKMMNSVTLEVALTNKRTTEQEMLVMILKKKMMNSGTLETLRRQTMIKTKMMRKIQLPSHL